MGFVAHRLGSPVGACLFIFDGEDGLHAQIGVLYVAPQARGVGIGNKLLAASISQARELELLSVSAELSERQTDLDHLYQTQALCAAGERRAIAVLDGRRIGGVTY
jgi:ribosomal protein S18 acetylase RimI-like enzyme